MNTERKEGKAERKQAEAERKGLHLQPLTLQELRKGPSPNSSITQNLLGVLEASPLLSMQKLNALQQSVEKLSALQNHLSLDKLSALQTVAEALSRMPKAVEAASRLSADKLTALQKTVDLASRLSSLDITNLSRTLEGAARLSSLYRNTSKKSADVAAYLTGPAPDYSHKLVSSPRFTESQSVVVKSVSDIGKAVRSAREKMELTQQRFADLASVGRRFVSELENGKPTLEFGKVLKVCEVAGIDLFAQLRQKHGIQKS